jgi:polar amino acid transport system substrate-binding protein
MRHARHARARALAIALLALATAAILAACGSTSDHALNASLGALDVHAKTTITPTKPTPQGNCGDPTASLRPPSTLPPPDLMPAGSYMAQIQRRGRLVAGVDQNTLLFAYFNTGDAAIEGFEVDLLHELSRAIFRDPNKIQYKAITTAQRIPVVQNGSVDIVVDAMTITCPRRQEVDFSTVYYAAQQKLLVPINSSIHSIADLAGKKVCATKGSTSLDNIVKLAPKAIPYQVAQRTDCLVALQQGAVDAVTSDDTILLGFEAQDPFTKIVGPSISPQPYGMAISKTHPEFVRFVNGVLERMRTDGTWAQIYKRWLGMLAGPTPPPPTPHYSG